MKKSLPFGFEFFISKVSKLKNSWKIITMNTQISLTWLHQLLTLCHIYLSSMCGFVHVLCMYSTYNVYLCLCTNLYVLTFFLNCLKVHCRHHYTSCLNSSACISWALGVSPLLAYLRDLTLIQWHLVVHSPYSHFSKAPVMTFENCCVLWFSPDHMLQFFVVCLF